MHAANALQLMLHSVTSADLLTIIGDNLEDYRLIDATSCSNTQGMQPNAVCKQEGDREIRCSRLFTTVSLGEVGTGDIHSLEGQGHWAIWSRERGGDMGP